ncbi:DNA N-glycosylase and apurinic/apyrimidinic (AP) lyase, partial [Ascosphaera pollenicola]
PPPLYLETYLDAADLLPNQSLVILDSRGRRWDALEGLYSEFPHLKPADKKIVLERWQIHLQQQQQHPNRLRERVLEKELAGVLSTLYKKLVLVFRALYSYTHYMPAYNYVRKTGKGKRTPITATSASAGLKLRWRVREGPAPSSTTPAGPPLVDDDVCPNLIAPLYRNSHGRGGAYHHYG